MRILYYSPHLKGIGRTIYRTIVDEAPGSTVAVCRTMDCLANSIEKSREDPVIAVVLAEREEHLLNAYFIKHRLYRAPLLLVLPDREPETRAIGFRIKAHSLCYTDSTVDEIRSAFRYILQTLWNREETSPTKVWNPFGPDIDLTDPMSGKRAA
jgi:hypothetical protein